jgi:hypothetical protein
MSSYDLVEFKKAFPSVYEEIQDLSHRVPYDDESGDCSLCEYISKILESHVCDVRCNSKEAEFGCLLSGMAGVVYDWHRPRVYTHLIRLRPKWIECGGQLTYPVLHCAAEYQPHFVPWLVEELGAQVNSIDTHHGGKVPLDRAYNSESVLAIQTLLRHGANVTTLGVREWTGLLDTPYYRGSVEHFVTTLVRRAYYLNLMSRIPRLRRDHYRILMDMLVPVYAETRSVRERIRIRF